MQTGETVLGRETNDAGFVVLAGEMHGAGFMQVSRNIKHIHSPISINLFLECLLFFLLKKSC